LPIFGPVLDGFVQWLHYLRGHTLATVSFYLNGVSKVAQWLHRRRIDSLTGLTLRDLAAAHCYFLGRNPSARDAARALELFLRAEGTVSEGPASAPSSTEAEVEHFAVYLREMRGFSDATIRGHRQQLRSFLEFLRFEHSPLRLRRLRTRDIDAFLRQCARTNNRFSLQHIVASVRAYLQWRHARGLLDKPLHQQIDTPQVHRGERLPRAIPWEQVQALLVSIALCGRCGHRDFALFYLAAAYGLRRGELAALRLDDIDWLNRTLRVTQTKTRHSLVLPLTDEAATVLIDYLRKGRPKSAYRELFLHATAPRCPLQPTAVGKVLARRIRNSGLELPAFGAHVLRHSFAMRLMRQGVAMKGIGDALGHRDVESTSIYLRLDMDDLREAALPVPATDPGDSTMELVSAKSLTQVRPARPLLHLPEHFQSWLAPSLQRYVDLKRALGRIFLNEVSVLGQWDEFVQREHPRAGRVHPRMFTQWTKELGRLSPTCNRMYQCKVRSFLLFHARDHVGTFIPDLLTFPKPVPAVAPRLISEMEMGRLLATTLQFPPTPHHPLRAETIRIGLLLMFCCGLRRGELLCIRLGDFEAAETVLRIRLTKFHKSRLVPLSPSVSTEIRQYFEKRRCQPMPMAAESFLMWNPRSSEVYTDTQLCTLWHQLCVSTRVLDAHGHSPRLHDLRHSFAVNTLQRWYAQGTDVQAKLPYLAAYLGHANAASTHYYLKLTPELGQSASERFHQRFAALFTAGGLA
jgi:site-specific recombinase XerD